MGSSRSGPRYVAFATATAFALVFAVSGGSMVRLWWFLDWGAGVLSLVSLTLTVMWGLAATDRILLGPGHRLVAQGVHRGTAVSGLGFLALHIWVKVAESSTTPLGAALPFSDGPQRILVGMGSVAGYLFLAVTVTGAVRGVFARSGRSRWWRALHMSAYVAWGISLVHGLFTGRPAANYVMFSYALCVVGVASALAVRLSPKRNEQPPPTTPPPTGRGKET